MELHSLEGNTQWLDGGAMFGNCPRPVWERWAPPDERHRIRLACRALLVRDGGRNILFEAGIGAFFDPKMRARYGVVEEEHVLLGSLAALDLTPDDIDVIVLSHLHFDHAGGILQAWAPDEPLALNFPNARYLVSDAAWERAQKPHARDRASFVPQLPKLLQETGHLEIVHGPTSTTLGGNYRFGFSQGHTPGLMLARIQTPKGGLTFMGDLVPGVPWVHLPITMGYDRYPELLIDEKYALFERIRAEGGWMFFTHDPNIAVARLFRDGDGRYKAVDGSATLHWSFPDNPRDEPF